ncbi:MAG: TIM barrel protein, partial [Planctomycetota bacterium]
GTRASLRSFFIVTFPLATNFWVGHPSPDNRWREVHLVGTIAPGKSCALESICLSTSFLPAGKPLSHEHLQRLPEFSVRSYELSEPVAAEDLRELGSALRSAERNICNLHFPLPRPGRSRSRGVPTAPLSPASPDAEERRQALAALQDTLEWAARLETRVVVLDCGHVDIPYPEARIHELFQQGRWLSQGKEIVRQLSARRRQSASRHCDALCLFLDKILLHAVRLEICIAMRNPCHPHGLPNADEFALLLQEFRGAPLGTWYDIGHAYLQETLGFETQGQLQEAMAPGYSGWHIHDAQGLTLGLPPGRGELPLKDLLQTAPVNIPWVMKCSPVDSSLGSLATGSLATGLEHLASLRRNS